MMGDVNDKPKAPLAPLVGWLVLPALAVAAVGGWPTWRFLGREGLAAMGMGAVSAFAGMFLSNALVVWRGGLRIEQLAARLAGATLIRLSICLAVAVCAWYTFALPTNALFLWTGAFYMVMLVGESLWLARTLRRTSPTSPPNPGDGGL